MAHIRYSIDGVDFRVFGVFVSESDGIVNKPKVKKLAVSSWDNYHGQDVDFSRRYYEAREIVLSCFIKADSYTDFLRRLFAFEQAFDVNRLQRLQILVGDKALVYEVYCEDEINITKHWLEGQMVGTFKLKLIEPQPVKRVLKFSRTSEQNKTCNIHLTTQKLINIYWGDGTNQEDISGQGLTLTHEYDTNGTYYPIVAGCIDEIEAFETNANILWNKL